MLPAGRRSRTTWVLVVALVSVGLLLFGGDADPDPRVVWAPVAPAPRAEGVVYRSGPDGLIPTAVGIDGSLPADPGPAARVLLGRLLGAGGVSDLWPGDTTVVGVDVTEGTAVVTLGGGAFGLAAPGADPARVTRALAEVVYTLTRVDGVDRVRVVTGDRSADGGGPPPAATGEGPDAGAGAATIAFGVPLDRDTVRAGAPDVPGEVLVDEPAERSRRTGPSLTVAGETAADVDVIVRVVDRSNRTVAETVAGVSSRRFSVTLDVGGAEPGIARIEVSRDVDGTRTILTRRLFVLIP